MTERRIVREQFLRSIPREQIFCEAMPAYALYVTTKEGIGWYCSRCGKPVKVVTTT